MAADHTLADRVLADQLERHAAQRFVGEPVSGMCRAAAVRLRKLDAIEEAVGDDLEMLQYPGIYVEDSGGGDDLEALCRRIADALGGTE